MTGISALSKQLIELQALSSESDESDRLLEVAL